MFLEWEDRTRAPFFAIGLFMGGSVFLGEFSLVNFIFDGLGVFFIGKGVVGMMTQSSEQ